MERLLVLVYDVDACYLERLKVERAGLASMDKENASDGHGGDVVKNSGNKAADITTYGMEKQLEEINRIECRSGLPRWIFDYAKFLIIIRI
jgi:hypothetical protein